MGIPSIFKNKVIWVFFVALMFVLQTISGEAITRVADKYGVFEYSWVEEVFKMVLAIVQSKLFLTIVSIAFGVTLGRLSLKWWLKVPAKSKILPHAEKTIIAAQASSSDSQAAPNVHEQLEGWVVSERDDFDIIPHNFIVRCTRNDSGFDCLAILFYKNRSLNYLPIKPLTAEWNIAGKVPDGKASHGVSTPVAKDKVDAIRFSNIRLYGEDEKHGQALFVFKFGQDLRCALAIAYDFAIRSYPEDKSTDMVVSQDVELKATYYVAPPEI